MSTEETVHKVTISLPYELFEFANQRAKALNTSRSQVIAQALAAARADTVEELAAEGYRFYAEEASEFSEASGLAVAEAWSELWQLSPREGEDAGGPPR